MTAPDLDALTLPQLHALSAALVQAVAAAVAAEKRGLGFDASLTVDDEAASITFSVGVSA